MAEQVAVTITTPAIGLTDAGDFIIYGGNRPSGVGVCDSTGSVLWSSSVYTKAQMYAGQTVPLPLGKDDTTGQIILWSRGNYAGCIAAGQCVNIPLLKITDNNVWVKITSVSVGGGANLLPNIPPTSSGPGTTYFNHPSKSLDGSSVVIDIDVVNTDNFTPHPASVSVTGSDGTAFVSSGNVATSFSGHMGHFTVLMDTSYYNTSIAVFSADVNVRVD